MIGRILHPRCALGSGFLPYGSRIEKPAWRYKLAGAVESTFQKALVDQQTMKEIKENYDRLKGNYGKVSWTPKDMITLTKEVGLADLIVPCYYMPMQQGHPTVKGMLDRLTQEPDGRIVPKERLDPE